MLEWTVVLVLLLIGQSTQQGNPISMNISYCEGDKFKMLTHDECPYGINFGAKKPDCVCINGVYRLWMDNCAVYDGFMISGCSTLRQGEWEVQGIRLTGSIASMTESTVVIFGLKETDYQKWDTYTIGQSAKTLADNFYTLNGSPILVVNGEVKSICVEKMDRPKFCRFYRHEQNEVWGTGNGEIEISVMEKCPSGTPLVQQSCYETLTVADSECSLKCTQKANTTGDGDSDPTDCKPPTISEIQKATNKYLNRQLNQYAKLRQVKMAPKPDHTQIKPIRTFGIFDIMRQIAKKACPPEFVTPKFIDLAADLFQVLHKGRNYRYVEDLDERNSGWIRDILHQCNKEILSLNLFGNELDEGCEDFQKASGVCVPAEEGSCINTLVNISAAHAGFRHHYVVDAAWNIVDLVQIVCFPFFVDSYRMFHTWEQSAEKLFTREIRKLWFNPGLGDIRVYQNLLTPTAVTDMHNLEMCVEAAYAVNPVLTRLIRPPAPKKFFRKKRDLSAASAHSAAAAGTPINYDVTCTKSEKDFQYPC